MKTLTDYTILYDNECPACTAYTKAFVQAGILDKEGRQPFTEAYACRLPNVDWDRARNEIAVINKTDGTIKYGVDGLVAIIAYNLKWVATLFQPQAVQFLLKKLYFFISFNRKVIAPGKVFEGSNTCTPDMNYTYRGAYILFCWLVTSTILVNYSLLLAPFVPPTNFAREFLICGGQILFQGSIILFVKKDRAIHYLGNMMTISLAGAMLLLPMFLIHIWIDLPILSIVYFMFVVGLMFLEHMRRVKILELPLVMSASWVLYRLIVLLVIL